MLAGGLKPLINIQKNSFQMAELYRQRRCTYFSVTLKWSRS